MDYRLLALDLDGTLLNDEERISNSNIEWVRKASEKNVRIIVATGRSFNSAKQYLRIIDLRKITLKDELIQELVQFLKDMDYCPIVYTAEGDKYYETFGKYTDDFLSFSKGFESELKRISRLSERRWDNVIRLSVITGEPDIPLLHAELKKRFGKKIKTIDTFFSGWNFWIFEILDKTCSKSSGIEFLCRNLGITREEVIAVGDNHNDLDMITWAGLGVGMRNGMDTVLREADYITEKTNNENGVSEVIRKFLFGMKE